MMRVSLHSAIFLCLVLVSFAAGLSITSSGLRLQNPGEYALLPGSALSSGYDLLYRNLPDNTLDRGFVRYDRRFRHFGSVGILFDMFSERHRWEGSLGLSAAYLLRRRGLWGFGLSLSALGQGYRASSVEYREGRDSPYDPALQNRQKWAIAADAGVAWRYDRLSLALSAHNVGSPNVSLLSDTADGEPLSFLLATRWYFDKYFEPFVNLIWSTRSGGIPREIIPVGGVKTELGRGFSLSASGGTRGLTARLSVQSSSLFNGLELGYEISYPLSKLGRMGLISHSFDIIVYGEQIRYTGIDLVLDDISLLAKPAVGERCPVRVAIANEGSKTSSGFTVTLFVQNDEGEIKQVYPSHFVNALPHDSAMTLMWRWKPRRAGAYRIIATVDDNGTRPLVPTGVVTEDDEGNNQKIIYVDVGGIRPGTIYPSFDKGTIEMARVMSEEIPLVPVVFFSPADSAIASDDSVTVLTIASRLMDNPDIALVLSGYIDPSDGEPSLRLAEGRARAIRRLIIAKYPQLDKHIIVRTPDTYDISLPRIPRNDISGADENEKVAEENRRAEMRAQSARALPNIIPVDYSPGDSGGKASAALPDDIVNLVTYNQDATLVMESKYIPSESKRLALKRAINLCDALIARYPALNRHIIIGVRADERPEISISIDFEGVLYRPRALAPRAIKISDINPRINPIVLKTQDLPDSFRIDALIDGVTALITNGSGAPPDTLRWDWRLESGETIPPDTPVALQLTLFSGGDAVQTTAPPVALAAKKTNIIERKLILVEFVFDETVPTSHYLEGRVDILARDIIRRAEDGRGFDVEIAGHTDDIGTAARNRELSLKRAQRELKRLRMWLAVLLDLTQDDLDNWLGAHKITIKAAGYGDSEPYRAHLTGRKGTILIGDNDTPRGRTLNRCVVAHIKE